MRLLLTGVRRLSAALRRPVGPSGLFVIGFLCFVAGVGLSYEVADLGYSKHYSPDGLQRLFGQVWVFISSTVLLGSLILLSSIPFGPPVSGLIRLVGFGALSGVFLLPAIDGYFDQVRIAKVKAEFDLLCKSAHVRLGSVDEHISGIFYSEPRSDAPRAEVLLNLSTLDYIERPTRHGSKIPMASPYERLEVDGERVRHYRSMSGPSTKYKTKPITERTASFEAFISGATRFSERIVRNEAELRRIPENVVIASAVSYYHSELRKDCPEGAGTSSMFMTQFIVRAIEMRRRPTK